MSIDVFYPVNMHVIGINLEEIDIYILKLLPKLFMSCFFLRKDEIY